MPESLDIQQFVVRVGEFGGYMVLETDNVADVQKLTTTFAVFQFRLEPVMDVMDAVAVKPRGSLGAIRTRPRKVYRSGNGKVPGTTIRH